MGTNASRVTVRACSVVSRSPTDKNTMGERKAAEGVGELPRDAARHASVEELELWLGQIEGSGRVRSHVAVG